MIVHFMLTSSEDILENEVRHLFLSYFVNGVDLETEGSNFDASTCLEKAEADRGGMLNNPNVSERDLVAFVVQCMEPCRRSPSLIFN